MAGLGASTVALVSFLDLALTWTVAVVLAAAVELDGAVEFAAGAVVLAVELDELVVFTAATDSI